MMDLAHALALLAQSQASEADLLDLLRQALIERDRAVIAAKVAGAALGALPAHIQAAIRPAMQAQLDAADAAMAAALADSG